ncbi:MAG: hypothetical protein B6D56_05705 [Candidatus Omnitrophica bacterium 4484_70.1]|nr:MAG: hypothetical protein B6D56_05705 [Candidatus Omnitrophica bacterium 4484_70.1]
MNNRRRFLRLETEDFLKVLPLNEVAREVEGKVFNLSLLGICFSSPVKWEKGQVLLIEYFIPPQLDSIKLKIMIIWSELVKENEYLCGAQIIDIDHSKEDMFVNYYFHKLKEKYLK